jgi:hypothetical protein
MGDRASISFKNGSDESVVLFSHWGGREFQQEAVDYIKTLKLDPKIQQGVYPLYRLEVGTIMVDFVREYTNGILKGERVESNLYLCSDEHGGDNSDNGHWIIDVHNPIDVPSINLEEELT